jgi:hypothetical protein
LEPLSLFEAGVLLFFHMTLAMQQQQVAGILVLPWHAAVSLY